MSKNRIDSQKTKIAALITVALFSLPCVVHADDFAELQRTKAMTLNLIQALVESGSITQDKANKLIADAQAKADAAVAALPEPVFKSRFSQTLSAPAVMPAPVASSNPASGTEMASEPSPAPVPVAAMPANAQQPSAAIVANIPQTNTPEVGPDGKRVVHVAYIPESTKREMAEQIKAEVLAQSKAERWGDPGTLPDWLNRVAISGDIRFRNFYTKLSPSNTLAGIAFQDGVFSRAPDIVGGALLGNLPPYNTQNNADNWYLRARLNIDAKVNDKVSIGTSLTTGNTTSRTSLSQGLGQNFNNESVVINRASIKVDPASWVSVTAGRMRNPFLGTDLLWADDLSFDGIVGSVNYNVTPTLNTALTAGYFPLRIDNPGTSDGRALVAMQFKLDWGITNKTQLTAGLGTFNYRNIVGTAETDTTQAGVSDYVSRYEYPSGFRQTGNTVFIINAPNDLTNINWGLASKFREVDLVAKLDYAHSENMHVTFTSDYVKNVGYNAHDIFERTGYTIKDGRNTGYQEKLEVGAPVIKDKGSWNVSVLYRKLGSDAVLDAFNNPDFGFGGTNNKGSIFTANYGIYKNTWLTARYLSSDLLESAVPLRTGATPLKTPIKLSVDMLQIELNARY